MHYQDHARRPIAYPTRIVVDDDEDREVAKRYGHQPRCDQDAVVIAKERSSHPPEVRNERQMNQHKNEIDRKVLASGGGRSWTALAGGALAQQREKAILRHRLSEQEALAQVAAHAGKRDRV